MPVADMWETGLSPAFEQCVAEQGSHAMNRGRDFEGAERFWDNYEEAEPTEEEFNPYYTTYAWILERAQNRA